MAPLDDVTDVVFREIVFKTAAPNVFFTEFTNVDGLNSVGREKLLPRFKFTKNQHPIIAQIWGKDPKNYTKVAQEIVQLGFDGIDINMGCPDKAICKNGCCAALINNHPLAREIIKATKRGAPDLPVSVKTRCGYKEWKTEEWFTFLLKQNLAAITVHGRIASEVSKYPARWEEISQVIKLRDQISPSTIIIGNGDVLNYEDGIKKSKDFGVDGLMIGRGIFADLWAFDKTANKPKLTKEIQLNLLLRHAQLFNKTWGNTKNFAILRKFFKIYATNFPGALELRTKLMSTHNLSEVEMIVKSTI